MKIHMSKLYDSSRSPVVIEIRNLKINYRNLHHFTIQQMIRNPALKGGEILHAVRGIDLQVREGEIIGIIGENGAGKSTLLKAIAGIFQPDEGTINTNGRRVSLMSLGVGFRWELSGRDNIMLAGLLLRYTPEYIRGKMQEIIDFAELGEAIDRPVRTYSSGMYSKLSFAITAVLETEIMLIDELLSVGDEQFQGKSYRKIQELVHRDNMTGVIVSHDMELIRNTCTRVVWMHRGKIQASGDPRKIADMYVRWSAVHGAEAPLLKKRISQRSKQDTDSISRDRSGFDRIRLFNGIDTDRETGLLITAGKDGNIAAERAGTAVNWEPLRVFKGTRLRVKTDQIFYRISFYHRQIPEEWIYTAAVQPEGNWTVYDREMSDTFWENDPEFIVPEDGYIRITICRKNGDLPGEKVFLEDWFDRTDPDGSGQEETGQNLPVEFAEELEKTEKEVCACRKPEDLTCILLADTHVTFGGTWPDTAVVIRKLAERLQPDAIIHLGDFTDGVFPDAVEKKVICRILTDMESTKIPVYVCPGNHDPAFFPRQFADFPEKKIRMVFLTSFEPEKEDPYGFSAEEISWLEQTLKDTPEGFGILVFSHVPPGREKTRWKEPIRGSREVMELLERYDREHRGAVLGVFYGHDHRDHVESAGSVPVIGVGCAKLEDRVRTPLHSGEFSRISGTVSQELLDVMLVRSREKRTELIRYGAGENRIVAKQENSDQ